MSVHLGSLRRLVLGISPNDISLARRGFTFGSDSIRDHLQAIPKAFAAGYHAGLESRSEPELGAKLDRQPAPLRGFAYEGAAMALGLLDQLTPWNRQRVKRFLDGSGAAHAYMVHVGVGWAMARVPGKIEPRLARLDPLLRWLAADGYGFHDGFFHWVRLRDGGAAPTRLSGYARRAFDQGLGRCLWFAEGAEAERISGAIRRFAPERRADLWSGVGLASVYAGGVGAETLRAIRQAAGKEQPWLAQGASFAAKARANAGLLEAHTETACQALCGMSAIDAAAVTDAALEGLPQDGAEPAYEVWRTRIAQRFRDEA